MLFVVAFSKEEPLHSIIARLCIRATRKKGINDDISFYHFVTHSYICQWLPQVQRVIAWISTILLEMEEEDHAKLIASKCQHLGVNINSLHLVALFAEYYQESAAGGAEEGMGMPPSYLSVVGDNSISKQDLILQQCIQGGELGWEDVEIGVFALEFVLDLVLAYYQPLKLLATLPPASLFHLLESATRERYPAAVECLENAIVPVVADDLLKLLVCSTSFLFFEYNYL